MRLVAFRKRLFINIFTANYKHQFRIQICTSHVHIKGTDYRQIIIDHSSIWGSLIGVCAIAVLFATRKFLFCEFDVADEIVLRASMKIDSVNHLLGTKIPKEECETLLEIFIKKCEEHHVEIGVGACIYFQDCGLRAAKTHDGKISRIEVIRAIH